MGSGGSHPAPSLYIRRGFDDQGCRGAYHPSSSRVALCLNLVADWTVGNFCQGLVAGRRFAILENRMTCHRVAHEMEVARGRLGKVDQITAEDNLIPFGIATQPADLRGSLQNGSLAGSRL